MSTSSAIPTEPSTAHSMHDILAVLYASIGIASFLIITKALYLKYRRLQSIHSLPLVYSPGSARSFNDPYLPCCSTEAAPSSGFRNNYLVGFLGSPSWESGIKVKLDKLVRSQAPRTTFPPAASTFSSTMSSSTAQSQFPSPLASLSSTAAFTAYSLSAPDLLTFPSEAHHRRSRSSQSNPSAGGATRPSLSSSRSPVADSMRSSGITRSNSSLRLVAEDISIHRPPAPLALPKKTKQDAHSGPRLPSTDTLPSMSTSVTTRRKSTPSLRSANIPRLRSSISQPHFLSLTSVLSEVFPPLPVAQSHLAHPNELGVMGSTTLPAPGSSLGGTVPLTDLEPMSRSHVPSDNRPPKSWQPLNVRLERKIVQSSQDQSTARHRLQAETNENVDPNARPKRSKSARKPRKQTPFSNVGDNRGTSPSLVGLGIDSGTSCKDGCIKMTGGSSMVVDGQPMPSFMDFSLV